MCYAAVDFATILATLTLSIHLLSVFFLQLCYIAATLGLEVCDACGLEAS